jgi:dynein heavy chain
VVASTSPTELSPGKPGRKVIYFLKRTATELTAANMAEHVLLGELSAEPLKHLQQIIHEVYMPVLSHPANQVGWGDVVTKEIMDKMHTFLANVSIMLSQTEGKTCLPLPPVDGGGRRASVAAAQSNKDRIHSLEGAVITWTKQIKGVLKQDPEHLLKQGLNPTPDKELVFWGSKAANLNAIYEQLPSSARRRLRRGWRPTTTSFK